jgi:AraC-like DNA-binding protein
VRAKLGAGDAVVVDTRLPYLFDFRSPVRQTVLKLPRSAAGRLETAAGRTVQVADSPAARVFNTILSELVQIDDRGSVGSGRVGKETGQFQAETSASGTEANAMAAAAIDILSAIYSAAQDSGTVLVGQEAMLKSAEDFVRSRFWDVRMAPALIAEHLGVSPRFLSQIFAGAGRSPAAYIRQVRLEEAARLLQHPSYRDAAIFDIGLRVGFPDATTFTRAFRRAYDVVPSEFRAAALSR